LSDQNRDERLQIMLTPDELAALDDWRFARRMPSRAAAVRELLRRGLTAEGIDLAEARMRSKDFGVTGEGPEYSRGNGASHERSGEGPAD
jgi:hypothetical protein